MITCLHGMSPRRPHSPGTTYERAETVQTTGATSPQSFCIAIYPDLSPHTSVGMQDLTLITGH